MRKGIIVAILFSLAFTVWTEGSAECDCVRREINEYYRAAYELLSDSAFDQNAELKAEYLSKINLLRATLTYESLRQMRRTKREIKRVLRTLKTRQEGPMYIIRRLVTVAWFVWIAAASNFFVWLGVFVCMRNERLFQQDKEEEVSFNTAYWERQSYKWMLASIAAVAVGVGYIVLIP